MSDIFEVRLHGEIIATRLSLADLYNLNTKPLGPGSYLIEVIINGAAVGRATFGLR